MVHAELSLAREVDESNHRIFPIFSLRIGREEHASDSSNHALFPENEANFGGNQLPDGSIRLSPLCRRRTICPSISKRAFAKDSPDFAFFRHISRVFPRVTLTQTTLKITVSGRCACVCVCVVEYCVCCVLCCAFL